MSADSTRVQALRGKLVHDASGCPLTTACGKLADGWRTAAVDEPVNCPRCLRVIHEAP